MLVQPIIGFRSFDRHAHASPPDITWTGSGTDGTCGGTAGSGAWWSCALNWSTSAVPTGSDHVIFDDTSTKSSTLDGSFAGTIDSITIGYDYTGTITQQTDFIVTNDYVQNGGTFVSDKDKIFSVGGSFFTADNQISNGAVYSIKKDSAGNMYVGGSFTELNKLPIKYLAKFDGNAWSAVGDSPDGAVEAIIIDSNDNVYIGGKFQNMGATQVDGIAMWDGNDWSPLDGGVTDGYSTGKVAGEVKALAVDDNDEIYVGGTFENAGSLNYANHLARWTGSNWEKFAHGLGSSPYDGGGGNDYLDGYVDVINVRNNSDPGATDKDVYVGGNFTNICGNDLCDSGNSNANYLVKYDGLAGTIATMADGADKPTRIIRAMTFDSSDNLYAVGYFSIGGNNYSVAEWDGADWTGMGNLDGTPYAIAENNGKIYIGGGIGGTITGSNLMQWVGGGGGLYGGWWNIDGVAGESTGRMVNGSINTLEKIGGKMYIAQRKFDIDKFLTRYNVCRQALNCEFSVFGY